MVHFRLGDLNYTAFLVYGARIITFSLYPFIWVQNHTLSLWQSPPHPRLPCLWALGSSGPGSLQNRCVCVFVSLCLLPLSRCFPSFSWNEFPVCFTKLAFQHIPPPAGWLPAPWCHAPLLHFMSLPSTPAFCSTIPHFGAAPSLNFPISPFEALQLKIPSGILLDTALLILPLST